MSEEIDETLQNKVHVINKKTVNKRVYYKGISDNMDVCVYPPVD